MKSYCVKQRKETECVEPSGYSDTLKMADQCFSAHALNVA